MYVWCLSDCCARALKKRMCNFGDLGDACLQTLIDRRRHVLYEGFRQSKHGVKFSYSCGANVDGYVYIYIYMLWVLYLFTMDAIVTRIRMFASDFRDNACAMRVGATIDNTDGRPLLNCKLHRMHQPCIRHQGQLCLSPGKTKYWYFFKKKLL